MFSSYASYRKTFTARRRMIIRHCFLCIALLGAALAVSCAAPPPGPTPIPVPPTVVSGVATAVPPTPASVPPTAIPPTATLAAATVLPTSASRPAASNATGKLDIDKLLPPAPGRELVLQYCVNCHNIAPIALAHKTKDEWTYLFYIDHVNRAPIGKADMDAIFNYFVTNYPPDRKVPDLPPELLQDWTSY